MKTKAQIRATRKYDEKSYDRVSLLLKKGDREKFREIAKQEGMSLNAWIIRKMNT